MKKEIEPPPPTQEQLDAALIVCLRIAAARGRQIRETKEKEKCQEKDNQEKSGS